MNFCQNSINSFSIVTKRKEYLFALLISFFTILVSIQFSTLGVDYHHQGIILNGAFGVFSNNGELYQEYYYHYGPLVAWVHGIILKLLGYRLIYLQYFTCFIYGIISFQIFLLSRQFLNIRFAVLTNLTWLFLAPYYLLELLPWSSVYAIPFFIIIFRNILKIDTIKSFYVIGICIALIFFIRQSSGIIALAALISLLPFYYKKLNYYGAYLGLATIFLPIIAILFFKGLLFDYWTSCISGQMYMVIKSTSFSESILKIIETVYYAVLGDHWIPFPKPHTIPYIKRAFNLFFALFVFISIIRIILLVIKKRRPALLKEWMLFLFAIVSLSQMYPIICLRHYYWAFTPVIPLIFYNLFILLRWVRIKNSFIYWSSLSIFSLVLTSAAFTRLEVGMRRLLVRDKEFVEFYNSSYPLLNGMYLPKDELPFLNELIKKSPKIKKIIPAQKSAEAYLFPLILNRLPNTIHDFKHLEILKGISVDSTKCKYRDTGINSELAQHLWYISK